MGNNCCSKDSADDQAFDFTKKNKRNMLSNMNRLQEDPTLSRHAPKSSIANTVQKMNEMSDTVKEIHTKEGVPKDTKQHLTDKYNEYPYLGPYKFQDGETYEGQFKDGLRHGFGKQIWPDGSIYEGFWENDQCNGKGRLINAEGHVYFGDWVNDKADGNGIFKHTDGTMYEGEWKDDVQNGYGKEVWNDGSVYEGMYLDSLKHGHGVFQWADGSKYEGQFERNDISGQGKRFDDRFYADSRPPGRHFWLKIFFQIFVFFENFQNFSIFGIFRFFDFFC